MRAQTLAPPPATRTVLVLVPVPESTMHSDRQPRSERETGGVVTNGAEGERGAALRVTCWGTRGSIPSPGPATTRYGGNTSCLEVRAGGRLLIFDAGTGIRGLGQRLAASADPVEADLFLTHFHWDHIQGLPFFAPLYDARTRLRIHGAPQDGVNARSELDARNDADVRS